MSGRRARKIRKGVYGETFSSRYRVYMSRQDGSIWSDPMRRMYQDRKREWTRGE